MTTQAPGLLHHLFPATSLLALLSLGGGIYGLSSPAEWCASATGASATAPAPTKAEQAYAAFAAARNFGGGITLLTLIALGYRQAVAVYLMTGSITGLADGWVCARFGDSEMGKKHALMAVAVGLSGLGVWISS